MPTLHQSRTATTGPGLKWEGQHRDVRHSWTSIIMNCRSTYVFLEQTLHERYLLASRFWPRNTTVNRSPANTTIVLRHWQEDYIIVSVQGPDHEVLRNI